MSIRVTGLLVPFGQAARIGDDEHATRFERGAFDVSIQAHHVPCWMNHRPDAVVASQDDYNLAFCETERGLFFSAMITSSHWELMITTAAALGLLHGASVGIGPARSVRWTGGVRVVDDIELREMSICIVRFRPTFTQTWARVQAA